VQRAAEVIENRACVEVSSALELPSVKGLSGYVIEQHQRRPTRFVDGSRIAYKTSADVLSKVVTLVVTVAAARALPAGDFGVMALAMTTGWILGVASDAGLPMYLATQSARATSAHLPLQPLVHAVMLWRCWLGAGALVAGATVGAVLLSPSALIPFTLIVAHQIFGAMLDTLAHAYRGLGRTEIESSLSIGHRGAIALAALTVLARQPSLLWLSIALAVPPMLAIGVSYRIASRLAIAETTATGTSGAVMTGAAGGPHGPPLITASHFARDVAPLGAGVLLSALYFRCDVYFLERLQGVETVGVYNATFRVVDALRLFAAAALAVAYPALCAASDFRPLRRLTVALAAASVVVAGAIYMGAHPLLALIYGDAYAAGGNALQVLSLCIPLFYVNYALTHQLIAWDGQRAYLGVTAAALLANLAGNALLIPDGGMVGAAASTLLTEMVVLLGCTIALRKR
jgi:O-antigen/teichoic acid export membrane protein